MEKWSICCTINVVIGSSSKRLLLVIVDSLLSLFNYFISSSLQSHVVVVVCTNTVRLHFYTLLCLLLYPQAKLFTMFRGYGTKKAISFTPMDHNIQLVEPGLQSATQELSITVSQVLYQLFILHSFQGINLKLHASPFIPSQLSHNRPKVSTWLPVTRLGSLNFGTLKRTSLSLTLKVTHLTESAGCRSILPEDSSAVPGKSTEPLVFMESPGSHFVYSIYGRSFD